MSYAPGAQCTLSVTYTPSVLGAETASLIVTDNATNSQTVALSGTGEEPVVLAPASLDFGIVGVNSSSALENITLYNYESVALRISSITTGNADFKEIDTCEGSVPAGGHCVITVTFTPSSVGAETGTLTVTDSASNNPQMAALTGTGVVPAVVSPTSLTFFGQVGITGTAQNVTLTNNLATALPLSITFTGANPGDFAETDTCGKSLATNSQCTIAVTFTAGVGGTRTATMNVNDGTSNSPQTVALSGYGSNPVVLTPTSLNFGNQEEFSTSAAQTVTLTNRQNISLAISSITISRTYFAQTNTCGSSVPAGGTCTISITFTPNFLGASEASLTVTDNASNSPQTVRMTGQGFQGAQVSPTRVIFPATQVGYTSAAENVRVSINATTAVPISITITAYNGNPGGNSEPGDFAETNTCGQSLGGIGNSSSCTISVTFTPNEAVGRSSLYTATMTVNDGASKPPTVTLEGTASASPLVGTTFSSLAFAPQGVGSPSAPQYVQLFNYTTTALTINTITFTGADPGDFSQTNTCGGSLAPESICTISVTFTPAATGTRAATMNINDTAYNTPQTVALTGTGQ
jgi:hypothetical protein